MALYIPSMTKKLYSTPEIEVSWEPDLCMHSGVCVHGSMKVFNPRRRPWIELEHESADRILEIVQRCPSGALKARRLGAGETGRKEEGADPRVGGCASQAEEAAKGGIPVITAAKNGPLLVTFACRVEDSDGKVLRSDERLALCRCGQSRNKPFCDGTHGKVGFEG